MELFDTILKILLKILFFAGLPCLVIYFRYKQKITTGFAVGMVLTSFLLGLISVSSFTPDLHKQLAAEINAKELDKAEHTLRLIVQGGPEEIEKIDDKGFIHPDVYRRLRLKLVNDYLGIAEKHESECSLHQDVSCSELTEQKSKLAKLKHALKLIGFAESIGGTDLNLKKNLSAKVADGEKVLKKLKTKCSAEGNE